MNLLVERVANGWIVYSADGNPNVYQSFDEMVQFMASYYKVF